MSSLLYIFIHTAKNQLLELKRKPGKLVLYLLFTALMIYMVVANTFMYTGEAESISDINWVKGILIVFLMFSVITSIIQGLAKGNVIFMMEDVNFLFTSPINPRTILMFGMFRTLKTAVLGSLFIFFQVGWLRTVFDVRMGGVFIIYAAYVLISIFTPILSVAIYSLTNGRPKRKSFIKILAAVIFTPFIIAAVWFIQKANWDFSTGLLEFLGSGISSFTPIAGWAATGAIMFITGNTAAGLLFFGLLVLSGVILIAAVYINNPDYYEDVLVATESLFEKQRTIAEGQVNMEAISDKRVRIKATGIKGNGASAWFYRHVREAFRASRFGLWGVSTPILIAGATIYTLMQTHIFDGDGNLLTVLISMMVIQTFLISMSRGERDLYTHYIYMVPENPLKKVIWSNFEIVFKIAVQNVFIFTISGIIIGEEVSMIIATIVTSTLFTFVLIGVNLLYLRFTGANMRSGVLIMMYYMTIMIVMLPGIAMAIVAGLLIDGWGLFAALIILSAWELIAGLLCFTSSKGILHNCDMLTSPQLGK